MSTLIDFEMLTVPAGNPEIRMDVAGGTLRAALTLDGAEGQDYDGASVTIEIDAASLPEGWSIADARRVFALELRRPVSTVGGVPAGLRRALVSGAAALELPASDPPSRPVVSVATRPSPRGPKSLPKTTKCRGCGERTVRVFMSVDKTFAQYDCPECACQDERRAAQAAA